jgi:hypothetical protein
MFVNARREKQSKYWLWSLIIFLFHRSLVSAVILPHEYCIAWNIVHPSCGGFAGGLAPTAGSGGIISPARGVRGKARVQG